MKVFKFSMQRLLDAREAQEKAEQQKLAHSRLKLERQKAALLRLHAERTGEIEFIAKLKHSMTDRTELSDRTRYVNHIESKVDQQMACIREQESEIGKIRESLIDLLRKKQTLERLRDRERTEWYAEGKRVEIREMDEIAMMSMARQGGSA